MQWVFAGFGFAFGMWLFMVGLRWAAGHLPLVLAVVKWGTIAGAIAFVVLMTFAWNQFAGVVIGCVGAIWFTWAGLSALPPFTSPSREL